MISLILAIALSVQAERYQIPAGADKGVCQAIYPQGLAGWSAGRPFKRDLAIGRTAQLEAMPVANVRLAIAPSRPLSGSHYASGSFEVTKAGAYRVAAGGIGAPIRPLWLDVAGADNKPLASIAHSHGPDCTSITKVVEFQLAPGTYTFLATGLTSAAPVRVLIVPKR